MSVVLDAVNTFFGHHPQPHHHHRSTGHSQPPPTPPPTSQFAEAPRRSDGPMSASGPRTPSSNNNSNNTNVNSSSANAAATHTVQQRHDGTPSSRSARAVSQGTPHATPDQPPEPPLVPRSSAPTPSVQQQQQQQAHQGQQGIMTPPATSATEAAVRPARRRKIKVRDLEHIQTFAVQDMDAFSETGGSGGGGGASGDPARSRASQDGPLYEISEMKVDHIIEMVAGLLTKITTTNDQQHEHLHRQPPHYDGAAAAAAHCGQLTNSVLAFHGKNIPSITILSYLSRIHKYCPTSYEVFLSLLVYFDRMTERVNAAPLESLRQQQQGLEHKDTTTTTATGSSGGGRDGARGSGSSDSLSSADAMQGVAATTPQGTQQATPPPSGGMENSTRRGVPGTPHSRARGVSPSMGSEAELVDALDPLDLSHFFVVDSFNIHRLVIAGVTCASKFFSDIFYTNSRYAKVGGLPLTELNHLELQFLLLNDFRLSVPVEEIEAYGTMLVEFYAREVVAQRRAAEEAAAMQRRSLSESSDSTTSTIRA